MGGGGGGSEANASLGASGSGQSKGPKKAAFSFVLGLAVGRRGPRNSQRGGLRTRFPFAKL